ncbi:ankyrin repeat, SAM and basic leucine zipper domain-containing protein 1 isoform X2 [Pectinophora gossypiella]|uniref:ankyrin repeat, SAM and basic leucine zipper domain-containing protein 1 isoform X2 n=1 Tax=Pectinophora gossypiella TaxID=13191 RepID=UPI00214EEB67|nr:ankyrin repeat, SAM and basic leucine zipper domain-containing protein 1 isoform X2 [Pectinophora gossypiella]
MAGCEGDQHLFAARNYHPVQQHNERKKIELNLQDAIINGNVLEVEKIVACDLNNEVNLKLDSGWTPLMHACFHAQEKIVRLLLDQGADPNLHADSVTPIMVACSNSSADNDTCYNIVTSLIEKSCILNIGDRYGQTPLMRAIGSGRVAVVQKLLDSGVNIEMRDQQGWTAVFWAVHHNQPEILEMLIAQGARLHEVDKSARTPIDIADSHDYQNIVEILQKQLKPAGDNADDVDNTEFLHKMTSWHEFYPGINKGEKITYTSEIPHLLYGMNCEYMSSKVLSSGMDLRTFLLMDNTDMSKLGVEMPFEQQRLRLGLRNFHLRGWKLNAVSGLYAARKADNFSALDCLTTLGSHLQQVYILEATLQYTLREYKKIQNQLKFEPPDSPLIKRLKQASKNILTNINSIRRETNNMKVALTKISTNNPEPADFIKEKSAQEVALGYVSEVVVICSLGYLVYHAKNFLAGLANTVAK